jgi:RHS repeat-associated protein
LDENLSMTRGGNAYYYMGDGPPRRVNLGSVRNIVESDEDVANTYDYYGFGDYLAASETVTSPYRYTGREYETGGVASPYYYRNRYYTAALGIFASRDAMWADLAMGWEYVENAPIMYDDPYGPGASGEGDDPEANDDPLQWLANDLYSLCPFLPGYGYLDCLGTCIAKNDPVSLIADRLDMAATKLSKSLNKMGKVAALVYMPFWKSWPVTTLFTHGRKIKGSNPWTNPLSMFSTLFRMGGRSRARMIGRAGAGAKLGYFSAFYGDSLALVELYCAVKCAVNPNSYR